jgi:hypothetical protein
MPQVKSHKDIPGYLLSLLMILAGVALILVAFNFAYKLFISPVAGLEFVGGKIPAPNGVNIGAALANFFVKLLLIIAMTWGGSIIASHGISMYGVASHWAETHQKKEAARAARAAKAVDADADADSE